MKYVSQRGLLTRAFSPSRRSIKLNIPQKTPYVAQRSRLREVAAPDALVKSASDLGVRVGGEDLSVTGLASVGPALGLCGADAIETGERRHLAEPAADEDVLEVVSVAGSEDLTEGARVELVHHLAVGADDGVHGVGLELGVVREGLHAHLGAPCVDDALVARGSRGGGRRGGGLLGGAGRSRRGSGGDGRVLSVFDFAGGGSGRGLLDVGGGHDGSLVDWGRGSLLSGLSGLGALGGVDGVNDSLVNDVDILHLLVLSGLGPGEVGSGDGRAGKGEDGGGVTHFDCVVEFGSKL